MQTNCPALEVCLEIKAQLVLRLELDNLLNQRHYAYTVFDGINTYTYDYGLCGRTIMLRATFKL